MRAEKEQFPAEIQKIIGSNRVETDNIGRSGALVAFIGDELVLKKAEKGRLYNAHLMQSFFHKHGLAPEMVYYASCDSDYLICARAEGKSAVDAEHTRKPKRLAGAMGEFLCRIHSLPICDCPVKNLTDSLYDEFDKAARRNEGIYKHIADYVKIETISQAQSAAAKAKSALQNNVVIHGDYCLPNIMLKDFSGKHVIDVGEGGAGDRHFDLFWGLWSLSYNLKTDMYREEFLSAYGRNLIDEDLIHACGCLCALI